MLAGFSSSIVSLYALSLLKMTVDLSAFYLASLIHSVIFLLFDMNMEAPSLVLYYKYPQTMSLCWDEVYLSLFQTLLPITIISYSCFGFVMSRCFTFTQ